MGEYDAYRNRINASGSSMQDAVYQASKRKIINDFLNSPTLSKVRLNSNLDYHSVIISDIETFYKRLILFLPETVLNVGDYVYHDDSIYLATDCKKYDLYPQLYVELCNETFVLTKEATKIIIGYDEFKRPIYESTAPTVFRIPCVMSTKIYSIVDNSAIPLPDGAMMIKLPYNPQQIPKINYIITLRNAQYKVTTISYEKVINEVGYVDIRLQRET
ncbi:hypothetical protein NSQ62_07805 [Solibacillus sp. FSL H8-0523]|uniref:hypothetical protein n=1 Tax=Solibacillus sp. FSL H8-0523 TaxID=2954511 RepID=UPI00310108E0